MLPYSALSGTVTPTRRSGVNAVSAVRITEQGRSPVLVETLGSGGGLPMLRSYQISTTNKSNGDAKEKRQFKFNSDVAGRPTLETAPPSSGPFSGGSLLTQGRPPVVSCLSSCWAGPRYICLITGCVGGV